MARTPAPTPPPSARQPAPIGRLCAAPRPRRPRTNERVAVSSSAAPAWWLGARAVVEEPAARSAHRAAGRGNPRAPLVRTPGPARAAASMGAAAVRWHLCVLLALGARGRLAGGSGLPGKPRPGRRGARGGCGGGVPGCPLCRVVWRAAAREVPCGLPPLCKVTSGTCAGRPLPSAREAPVFGARRARSRAEWAEAPGEEEFEGGRKKESAMAGRGGLGAHRRRKGDPGVRESDGRSPRERGARAEGGSEGSRAGVTAGKGQAQREKGGTDGQKKRHGGPHKRTQEETQGKTWQSGEDTQRQEGERRGPRAGGGKRTAGEKEGA